MNAGSIILILWLIPCVLLTLFWFVINFCRLTKGQRKLLNKKEKVKLLMPTTWCIIFALVPVVNILAFLMCCMMICFEENRRILFGERD